LGFGRSYAPEKSALTHPFKLNALAILCAGSGEVMVIPTNTSFNAITNRDWAQGKADVTKVGPGYSFTTPTFYTVGPFIRTLDKVREQGFPCVSAYPSWWGHGCELPRK
jgi:hypothetical protein